jgi:hypothetical protein
MRKVLILTIALAALPFVWQTAEACGDKFLLVGRGAKFQRAYASVYPGNILIYARPSTSAKAAIRDPKLHKQLRQAGHAVSVIEDARLLEQALHSSAFDIVLADVVEAPSLEPQVAAASSRPNAMYVDHSSGSKETQALRAQYACPLKSSDRSITYLDKIENTMKARATARRKS